MRTDILMDDSFAVGGFTSGREGIWTRESADMPPTSDYAELSAALGTTPEKMVRPYQANGQRAAIVVPRHGGSGINKDNELTKTDGLVTAHRGLALTVIAADCAPVYLADRKAGVIGLLHCGRQAAAGELLRNGIGCMELLGASKAHITMTVGHHICGSCYEVGEEVYSEFAESFSAEELSCIFTISEGRFFLSLFQTLRYKGLESGIAEESISRWGECTCHCTDFYSYRRGDRGKQDLAFLMMR